MEQPQNPNNHQNNRDGKQSNNSPITPITGTLLSLTLYVLGVAILGWLIHDYIPLGERGKLFTESVFSLAIVIVVIIQARIYFRQARALDAQLEETRKATRYGQSAYITVKSIGLTKFNIGELIEAQVVFVNTGNTPAYQVDSFTKGGMRREPFTFSISDLVKESPDDGIKSGGILGARQDTYTQIVKSRALLTDIGIEREKHLPYHVWGVVFYTDIFKRRRWTQFCFQRRPGETGFNLGISDANKTSDQEEG